jgi:hypothetical protein
MYWKHLNLRIVGGIGLINSGPNAFDVRVL